MSKVRIVVGGAVLAGFTALTFAGAAAADTGTGGWKEGAGTHQSAAGHDDDPLLEHWWLWALLEQLESGGSGWWPHHWSDGGVLD